MATDGMPRRDNPRDQAIDEVKKVCILLSNFAPWDVVSPDEIQTMRKALREALEILPKLSPGKWEDQ